MRWCKPIIASVVIEIVPNRRRAREIQRVPPCRGTRQTSIGGAADAERSAKATASSHHGRGHLRFQQAQRAPVQRTGRSGSASRATLAGQPSPSFRRARKWRATLPSPTSPCPSPTGSGKGSPTAHGQSQKSPAASDPNKGRTTSRKTIRGFIRPPIRNIIPALMENPETIQLGDAIR